MYPNQPDLNISHQTIYGFIHVLAYGELKKELLSYLRKKGKPCKSATDQRGQIAHMRLIHDRPESVAGRSIGGHWEGDLIKGAGNKSSVGTLVERKSRFVQLIKLDGATAADALEGFSRAFERIPTVIRESMTYDRGKEMACHVELAERLKLDIYFCDPHSPWQRGSNENANGLIREYLPKGIDLSEFSQEYLDKIARALNGRPRKVLGFRTPEEVFSQEVIQLHNAVALQSWDRPGKDDVNFCARITQALNEGYELYGSPTMTFNGVDVIVGQSVTKEVADESEIPDGLKQAMAQLSSN